MSLPLNRIACTDVLDYLQALPDGCVNCCVTSPPYWGLRDYGTAQWEGGDSGCEHTGTRRNHSDEKQATQAGSSRDKVGRECRFCGAVRIDRQLGLEPTPDAYVARMAEVFAEVRRVLTDDGVCWVNLGDSYASGGTVGRNDTTPEALTRRAKRYSTGTGSGSMVGRQGSRPLAPGFKPKDLCGIPWRVAFALQASGWYLRSDVIWHKPNAFPESVTDRPTKAHEYIFLLSKSERYWYDADAIAERAFTRERAREKGNGESAVDTKLRGFGSHCGTYGTSRNRRTVWTIPTEPCAEAHFAVMPKALVSLCIRAGCPEGGVVLDPFMGAGTVALVATALGRQWLGCDLNPEYVALAERRLDRECGLLLDHTAAAPEQLEGLG